MDFGGAQNSNKVRCVMKINFSVFVVFMTFVVFCAFSASFAEDYKYKYSGIECNGARESVLMFNIKDDGTIEGKQIVEKVCGSNYRLAGGEITFTAHLTGSYPQVQGTFRGKSIPCSGRPFPVSGVFKMGYHPDFGVFTQLFNSYTGTEWYFRRASNPFE